MKYRFALSRVRMSKWRNLCLTWKNVKQRLKYNNNNNKWFINSKQDRPLSTSY